MSGYRETNASNYRLKPHRHPRTQRRAQAFAFVRDKLYGEKVQACAGVDKKKETAKNYSAAQIFHAIRGAGTEAGTSLLDAAGGAFTKMQERPRPPTSTPPPSQQ